MHVLKHEHASLAGGEGEGRESGDRCPTCNQAIPQELSRSVRERIAAHEEQERARLRAEVAAERKETDLRHQREIETLRASQAEALERVREAARAEAEGALLKRLAEAEQARDRALSESREAARRAAADMEASLAAERERLAQAATLAVQAEQQKAFEEKQRSLAKIAELQRQLESKTAQELGEAPEADLYELLKAEFPEDRLQRVEKGASGADVIHDIYLNGRHAGRIVYDSKNRSAWRNDYVTKLRGDQLEAKADHAVLASKVFPSGVREIHLQDGVLVVSPARVLPIAQLLRKQVLQMFTLRSSNDARAHKTEALYAFIVSERCRQLLSEVDRQSDEMVELDRREERAHQATWKRRAELIRVLQRAHGDLTFEIERIIGVAGNRGGADDAD